MLVCSPLFVGARTFVRAKYRLSSSRNHLRHEKIDRTGFIRVQDSFSTAVLGQRTPLGHTFLSPMFVAKNTRTLTAVRPKRDERTTGRTQARHHARCTADMQLATE